MPTDSPTYNCSYAGVPSGIPGAEPPFCVRPGGYVFNHDESNGKRFALFVEHREAYKRQLYRHPRMDTCCSQLGNGSTYLYQDCYTWCSVNSDVDLTDFSECLLYGSNSTTLSGGNIPLMCGLGSPDSDTDHPDESNDSGGDEESSSPMAYKPPQMTLSALVYGALALSILYF